MRNKEILSILASAIMIAFPVRASAQIDAIIDAVVDAVEPTPVYDNNLTDAALDLVDKIDRLSDVLFGGSSENSAAYRYRTMASDLNEIVSALASYAQFAYKSAETLQRVYSDTGSPQDGAYAISSTWTTCEKGIRDAEKIVQDFKRLFSDPSLTNSEIRQLARSAAQSISEMEQKHRQDLSTALECHRISEDLLECSCFMEISPNGSIQSPADRQMSMQTLSGLPAVALLIIGVILAFFTLFVGAKIMKSDPSSSELVSKMILVTFISIVILSAMQKFLL